MGVMRAMSRKTEMVLPTSYAGEKVKIVIKCCQYPSSCVIEVLRCSFEKMAAYIL